MPRTNEIRAKANNSNRNFAPSSAKTVSYRDFEIEKNAKNKAYYFRSICKVLQNLSFERPSQGLFRIAIV